MVQGGVAVSIINKGIVLSREGNKVRVQSTTSEGTVSPLIALTSNLRVNNVITKGTEVVYVLFPDGTGLVLNRLDGEG